MLSELFTSLNLMDPNEEFGPRRRRNPPPVPAFLDPGTPTPAPAPPPTPTPGIRNVWKQNLYDEFAVVRAIAKDYHYVAMDTEFPGVVFRPEGDYKTMPGYQYQLVKMNVDVLNLIQLGITFMDAKGKKPPGIHTWQFNFKFSLTEDLYAQESIDLLVNSGIPFEKLETDGIDWRTFSELLTTSGLVLSDTMTWISFHGGHDLGYLMKVLMDQQLPETEEGFYVLLKLFFPHLYDLKYLMKFGQHLRGGLQYLADQMQVEKVGTGTAHQAGSDSFVTALTFFRMKELVFGNNIDESKYGGHLFGIGNPFFF